MIQGKIYRTFLLVIQEVTLISKVVRKGSKQYSKGGKREKLSNCQNEKNYHEFQRFRGLILQP